MPDSRFSNTPLLPTVRPRIISVTAWSLLGAVLAVTAYLLVSTTFMPYDDEGYVLISLRNYLAGLRLYDDVFSQYGPWPYVYHEGVSKLLQADVTHALGRALTVFHWVTMALGSAVIGWQLTRKRLGAFLSATLTFGLCWQNISEPSHPGSHITLLVALAAILLGRVPDASRPWLPYAGLGIIAALLLLTKINVGLLLVAGLGCWVLRYTAWAGPVPRLASMLATAGLLAVPWVLLGRQLEHGWVLALAIHFTLAAAGLLWISPRERMSANLPSRAWIAAPLAALLAGALVCLRVWQHGTSAESLWAAVLIKPLQMPSHFVVGLTWYPEAWLLAAAGTIGVIKAGHELRLQGRVRTGTVWTLAVLRVLVVTLFLVQARFWPSYSGIFHFSAYCLPLLPAFLVPLAPPVGKTQQLTRIGVAGLALAQVLHVFPVAGSQLAWATFLCVPVLIAGVLELRQVLPDLLPRFGTRLVRVGGIALVIAALGQLFLLMHTGWDRYAHSRPLDLPGAGDIRLDGDTRQTFRLLHLNAGIHADLLFSRQGMFSHNLWSGIPTPTAQNATHWFWLLNEAQQGEIIARLAATPRTAFITSQSLDEFMVKENIPVRGPLQDFLEARYRPLFRHRDFTFHVPRESDAIAFGRFELLEPETSDGTVLFRTAVLLDGRPARIGLERINHPWDRGPELLGPGTQAVAEPIDRGGRATGEPVALPSSAPLRGLYRLSVISPRLPPKLPWQDYLLVVHDQAGNRLSESVY